MTDHLSALIKSKVDPNPIGQFARWFADAKATGMSEQDAVSMTLATANKDGRPSARIVLLKDFDEQGFVFYTNYDSGKGQELAENPRAVCCSIGLRCGGRYGLRALSRRFPKLSQTSTSIRARSAASSAPGLPIKASPLKAASN